MLIEGQESCRVPIPVDRCPLHKLMGIYEDTDRSKNININKICSEHITELVDLRWHLSTTDIKGIASLKGINLTPRMLDIVKMSPLDWGKCDTVLKFKLKLYTIQFKRKE